MKPPEGLAVFKRIVFGWLPRDPGATSSPGERAPMGRARRLASFFVFEFLVVFVVLTVLQLVGLENYSGFIAGAAGGIAAAAAGVLFQRPAKRRGSPTQVAGLDTDQKSDEAR
jgi:hypothetical protein